MASPLHLMTMVQRMFEVALEFYLDVEDVVRFFFEQSGTRRRLRRLTNHCTRRLHRQQRALMQNIQNWLPIGFLGPNESQLDANAFSNISVMDTTEISSSRVMHRGYLGTLTLKTTACNQLPNEIPFSGLEGPRCSTPISTSSSFLNVGDCVAARSSTTVAKILTENSTLNRISYLEQELTKLREQVAAILLTQENARYADKPQLSLVGTSTQVPPPLPLPPPPPPPPPPPLPTFCLGATTKVDFKSVRKTTNKLKMSQNLPGLPNMTDILKGMSNVKLKPIQRSPGGTPIRPKKIDSSLDDPSVILANALKKRLARVALSDTRDSENNNSSFDCSSCEESSANCSSLVS